MGNGTVDPNLIGQIQATEAQPSAPPAAPPPSGGTPVSAASVSRDVGQGAPAASTAGASALGWAKAGQLSINPDEGQALVNTLNTEISNLRGLGEDIRQMGMETKLGETPNAAKFAQFNMDVAKTGPHALLPNHELLIEGLEQMSQAVRIAMENYRNAEQANADRIKGIHE
jgi:uncharacterized protein YukE